jgi:hypothetical protein
MEFQIGYDVASRYAENRVLEKLISKPPNESEQIMEEV